MKRVNQGSIPKKWNQRTTSGIIATMNMPKKAVNYGEIVENGVCNRINTSDSSRYVEAVRNDKILELNRRLKQNASP